MVSSEDGPRWIPIAKLARQWGRSVDHIKAHVKAGRLTAMDTRTGAKEQLVILLADVEAFEQGRATTLKPKRKAPPPLKRPPNHVDRFIQARTKSATARKRSSSTE